MMLSEDDVTKAAEYLGRQFELGRPILFTGTGFSSHAVNLDGAPIPSSRQLAHALWQLVYPGEPPEADLQLQDIFENAKRRNSTATKDLLVRQLSVDTARTDFTLYEKIFSLPWYRSYTVNIDTLARAVGSARKFRRQVVPFDASPDVLDSPERRGSIAECLFVAHLHGLLENAPSGVTFGRLQYGARVAGSDPWYEVLSGELLLHPIVFIGTSLDEPPLWKYIEERRRRGHAVERRLKSFLVAPTLPRARATLLEDFNVGWLPLGLKEFVEQIVSRLPEVAVSKGFDVLRARAADVQENEENDREVFTADRFLVASQLKPQSTGHSFLLGTEPSWSDVVGGGAAAIRTCEDALSERCGELLATKAHSLLVVTGTAGSGKSTVMKRLAHRLVQDGKLVGWIDQMHRPQILTIRSTLAAEQGPKILIVDDAAIYGNSLPEVVFAARASDLPVLLVLGLRSALVERRLGSVPRDGGYREFVVPDLDDSDIDGLLDSLSRFNRLGVLSRLPRDEQHLVFRDKCGRQLLVAMIEATYGVRFDEKCRSEFDELTSAEQAFYGVVAVATSRQIVLSREDCVLATDQKSNEAIDALEKMLSRGLIARLGSGLRLRHAVIAERVVDRLVKEGRMPALLGGLLTALCLKLDFSASRKTRPWMNVIRLLNHDYLFRVAGLTGAQRVYAELETLLAREYHYWLQRSCLEIESGDAQQGELFVSQAYGIEPNDPYVRAERAYAWLKRARSAPRAAGAADRVKSAIDELREIIDVRGKIDHYAYHILGSQVLAWTREAGLPQEERLALLGLAEQEVINGLKVFPRDRDLQILQRDLTKERIAVATGLS